VQRACLPSFIGSNTCLGERKLSVPKLERGQKSKQSTHHMVAGFHEQKLRREESISYVRHRQMPVYGGLQLHTFHGRHTLDSKLSGSIDTCQSRPK